MSTSNSEPFTEQEPKPREPARQDEEYADAEKNFQPRTLKFWLIMVSIYISIFLVALDRLIIATAIPSITDEFHSIEDIGWYGSAYMLTCAIFNPLFGKIYQLYSTKWVYLGSIIVFEVGSAVCGAAPSSSTLIAGRAIAGGGSAGIFVGGIMIMVPLVPLRKRPVFSSFFGMAFGISSILGPIIGGTFTDNRYGHIRLFGNKANKC
jgi:MFS family permease